MKASKAKGDPSGGKAEQDDAGAGSVKPADAGKKGTPSSLGWALVKGSEAR
jgi:hypothetical protein